MAYYSPIRSPRQDCGTRLLRQLGDLAGEDAAVNRTALEAWASGMFVGTRHSVTIALVGSDAEERISSLEHSLPEAEFTISGHIVADLAIEDHCMMEANRHILHLSVLTITEN